jgi:nitronate monooxygenase
MIASPMFIVSRHELVLAQCRAGVVGSFPPLNARPRACWSNGCSGLQASWPSTRPFAVNLIVHKTSARLEEDLALCVKYRAWAVITSLGANTEVFHAIHS